jgi:aerobic carbon-monoxide dehydrogenase small subunit
MTYTIKTCINGSPVERTVEPRVSAADFLRHHLGLTGTHVGCEHGACGACTISVDGAAVRSCLMLAVQLNGKEVATVESLGTPEALSPLQKAFSEHHALQCGFCTPGVLMTVQTFLDNAPQDHVPSEDEARELLSGNVCRCTGYQGMVEAVRSVCEQRAAAAKEKA